MNQTAVVSVGIDVSKTRLDIACVREDRTALHEAFNNSQRGISALMRFLRRQRTAAAVPCVLEATGDYHLLAALMLARGGFNVKCINPLITKRYQKSTVRDAKSDKIDCVRLATIGMMECDLPSFVETRETIAAKKLVSSLAHLETVKQKLSAHVQMLKETHHTLGIRGSYRATERAIANIDRQMDIYRDLLCAAAPQEARVIAEGMPGVSHAQVATLLIALGDKSFANRDQLVAFVGLDVRVRQSGSWHGRQVISKRGNGYLRKVLFQIGWGLMMNHQEYRRLYERMRARGKNFKTCIIALARKFLRFLFAMYWKRRATLLPPSTAAPTV